MKISKVLIISTLYVFHIQIVYSELCMSVAQLSNWMQLTEDNLSYIDDSIEQSITVTSKLKNLRSLISTMTRQYSHGSKEIFNSETELEMLFSPPLAIAYLKRYVKATGNIHLLFEEIESTYSNLASGLRHIQRLIPSDVDVDSCARSMLRLQRLYGLEIYDELEKKLLNNLTVMPNDYFFHLGYIAYDDGFYNESIYWFEKFIEVSKSNKSEEINVKIIESLDRMAIASYNLGEFNRAIYYTAKWIQRDPNNSRALENIKIYHEESISDNHESRRNEQVQLYNYLPGNDFNVQNYNFFNDELVRNLCKEEEKLTTGSCEWQVDFTSSSIVTKKEILSEDPQIIRFYDILNKREAKVIQKLALPKLERSTVQHNSGLVITDFRSAKTAWLAVNSDPIVELIERRLRNILKLDIANSEDLQVVNYGLGGFYGPHMDSKRLTYSAGLKDHPKCCDRKVTILIYLSDVNEGGSTVFPKLNLTIKPVAGSAIVWHNIRPDGFSEDRTLHTACPVLSGSKWIATKWVRENPNFFYANN